MLADRATTRIAVTESCIFGHCTMLECMQCGAGGGRTILRTTTNSYPRFIKRRVVDLRTVENRIVLLCNILFKKEVPDGVTTIVVGICDDAVQPRHKTTKGVRAT